jgi:hypothetical protein
MFEAMREGISRPRYEQLAKTDLIEIKRLELVQVAVEPLNWQSIQLASQLSCKLFTFYRLFRIRLWGRGAVGAHVSSAGRKQRMPVT